MKAQPDVEKLIFKTRQYEFADGLRDIQLGVMFASMGLMGWFVLDPASVWLPAMVRLMHDFGKWAGWSIQVVVFIPALLGLVLLVGMRYVRRRWLWKESGMVKSRRWMVSTRVSLISGVIFLVPFLFGAGLQRIVALPELFLLRLLIVASGWSAAYTLAVVGRDLELPRYGRAAVFIAVAPTALLFIPLTVGQTWLLWGLLSGGALLVSGYGPLRDRITAAREEM